MGQLYSYQRLRIHQDEVIHIKRQLPGGRGSFFVAQGQEVSPEEILGEGEHLSGFRTVHLAKELGVNPKQALKYLKRSLGKNIYQGELLALNEGLLSFKKKILLSPVDGVVEDYDEKRGDLKIKLLPKPQKVISGVYGIVESIDQVSKSVTIKTQATVICTVLGTGRERTGMLKFIGAPGDLISSKQILPSLTGSIVVGGGLIALDALEKAVSIGVAGFVSGGVNYNDYKSMAGPQVWEAAGKWMVPKKHWTDVGISLVVTEGFGLIPLGEDVIGVLKKHEGKFAIIDGNGNKLILPSQSQNSMMYVRKITLPSMPCTKFVPRKDLVTLGIGIRARVVSAPFLGYQGIIEAIDKTPTKLPSGIITYMVTINTSRKKIKMPYENIEVIG